MKEVFQGDENFRKWAKVITQAWADEAFKEKLFETPIPALKEFGIEFPQNTQVNFLDGEEGSEPAWEENTNRFTIPLPPRPQVMAAGKTLRLIQKTLKSWQ
jgi:hypothetical protein